jgi:hypothetical protein
MATSARRATMAILALHGILLVASLPDYFVSIDSGYHVSLARWYGEHGSAWWDHINFGPGGRPNLQGPLMHMAIGFLGRAVCGHAAIGGAVRFHLVRGGTSFGLDLHLLGVGGAATRR